MNEKIIRPFFLIISILLVFSLSSCLFKSAEPETADEIPAGQDVSIVIEEGMNLTQISAVLEEAGVVDSALLFRLFVQQRGKETNLVPGEYEMVTGSDYEEVMEQLITGPPVVSFFVTIPEGYTVIDIIGKFASELPFIDKYDMEAAADAGNYDYSFLDGAKSLEGFLFPKTYEVTMDYSAANIIGLMLAQYEFETGDLDYASLEDKGLSDYDVLIIASMIEREAYIPEERELISAVIHNRLDIGMALGIDATLSYYLQKWEEPLTESDLDTDTLYNTRLYSGLPPTPICNPGLASIKAAISPADVDYLYFVVTDSETHEHSFTSDYNEHLNNINNAK